jgi:cephalosporin-C deacetylase-like acetyl esterase
MKKQENNWTTRDFFTQIQTRKVPASIWLPTEAEVPRPVVLVGHGGSGHKRSQLVLDIVQELIQKHQIAVVAIDGPVHGARRDVFMDGTVVRQEFRDLWSTGLSVDPMVEDWKSCIDYITQLPEIDSQRIGWYGISMGSAYGIPLIAKEDRIKVAALGMWGTCRSPADRLKEDATKIKIPVLFQEKEQDEIFTSAGQLDLYQCLGSSQKKYQTYPGGHTDPKDQQLNDIVQFLSQHLLA